MLTISWPKSTEATMNIVIIFAAVIIPLDCPNNRANWPIPEAHSQRRIRCGNVGMNLQGVFLFFAAYVWMKQVSDSLANLAKRL